MTNATRTVILDEINLLVKYWGVGNIPVEIAARGIKDDYDLDWSDFAWVRSVLNIANTPA